MRNTLDLLSVEGSDYMDQKAKLERIRDRLRPHLPEGVRLVIHENNHDFGPYPSLVVTYEAEAPEHVLRAAYSLEEIVFHVADELGIKY